MHSPLYQAQFRGREAETLRFDLEIPAGSPYLQGHFPNQAILPGVAQVQICAELLGQALDKPVRLLEVLNVRFRKPVTPGLRCEVQLRLRGYELSFDIRSPEGRMAEGSMLLCDSLQLEEEAAGHA